MAAAWPTVEDVKGLLRIVDSTDDTLITSDLAAAVDWVTARISDPWIPGNPGYIGYVANPLYTVALHEAARLVRRRDSVDGTIGWGDMGVVRVGPKDPDIETLIAPYLALVVG